MPGAGGQLFCYGEMVDYGDDVDEDSERYEGYSGDDGVGGGGWGLLVLGGGELAEEEAEAADGEAYAHEAEAGADPGEEGALGGEVDAGILLGGVWHVGDCSVGGGGADSRFPAGMTERKAGARARARAKARANAGVSPLRFALVEMTAFICERVVRVVG